MKKVISIGAEAVIIRQDTKLIKERVKKGYRHADLDEKLRKLRTRKEAKLLEKASGIINVPMVIEVDDKTKEIAMEFLEGERLSETLDSFPLKQAIEICEEIGMAVAKLHDANIIHGDLTTSNVMLCGRKIFFIDFGLGFESGKIEDKAVDLHLLRQAFESRHFTRWQDYFKAAIGGYKHSKTTASVVKQLEKVESRGRYKGKR